MKFGVFYRGAPLGELTSDRARLRFTYDPAVVDDGEPMLSVRLAVRQEPYGHDDAHAFFANLLPEDEYRIDLARVLGLSDRNVAGLLGAVGGECAGAVSIWPSGQHPPLQPEYVPLSDGDVRRLLNAADADERMVLIRENRLSLAGGMEKLGLLRKDDGRWYRGRAGAPTTHILKWPQTRFPDQSYNELFCLSLWGAAGLGVPSAHVEGKDTPVLVVERYDRRAAADGTIALIHQEDLCQALGLDSAQKYQGEGEGGPGLADSARIIRTHCAVPARELAQLLRWALGNFLVGNGDGHGKNLSLLHGPDGIRLAPFYDVASTVAYPGLSRKLAMSVGGEYRFAWVRARHWEALAEQIGVPVSALRRDGLGLAERFERELPRVRQALVEQYGDQPIFAKVADVVGEQIALLREHLPVPRASRRKGHPDA